MGRIRCAWQERLRSSKGTRRSKDLVTSGVVTVKGLQIAPAAAFNSFPTFFGAVSGPLFGTLPTAPPSSQSFYVLKAQAHPKFPSSWNTRIWIISSRTGKEEQRLLHPVWGEAVSTYRKIAAKGRRFHQSIGTQSEKIPLLIFEQGRSTHAHLQSPQLYF